MSVLKLRCATGQSPMAAVPHIGGGNTATVQECGVWEQFPKAVYSQTAGMKFIGPTHAYWPFRSDFVPPRPVVSGMDYTHCRQYRNANPTHKQVLVRQAAGGQPASEWLYENNMISVLRQSWDACMQSPEMAAWGPRCADTFAVSQGERDYQTDGDMWVSMWLSIMDSLRRPHGPWQYPIIGPDTRIAFCESPSIALNARNVDLPKLTNHGIKIVSAAGIVPYDDIHADGRGLEIMGVRMWNVLEGPGWSA